MKKSKVIFLILLACAMLLAWGCGRRADGNTSVIPEETQTPAPTAQQTEASAQQEEGTTITSVTVDRYPSYGDFSEMVLDETTITPDGLVSYAEYQQYDADGQEYAPGNMPVLGSSTMQINPDGFAAIVNAIESNGFYSLPEYLDTEVMDGDYVYLTVRMDDGTQYRSGGLVADSEGPDAYKNIFRVIQDTLSGAVQNPGDAG